jgi:hypothetical protein
MPTGAGGGVATLPRPNSCEQPITFSLTIPKKKIENVVAGSDVRVEAVGDELEILSDGVTLGLVPGRLSGRVKRCMDNGFKFQGAINQISDIRPEIVITIAGVAFASS